MKSSKEQNQAAAAIQTRVPADAAHRLDEATSYIGQACATPAVLPIPSAAALTARNLLHHGEVVLLLLKPSRWSIVLGGLLFTASVAIILCALHLSRTPQPYMRYYLDAGLFAISCRLMWGTLHWMGRVYVLTNQRILRITGVFNVEVFDCLLRKVAHTRVTRTPADRMLRLGAIEIYPQDESHPCCAWQWVRHADHVNEQIVAAIRKAKQGGCGEEER